MFTLTYIGASQVSNNARSSLLLKSLSRVASEHGISLCGKSTCLELVYAAVFRLGWQAAAVLAVLLIAAPNLILTLLHFMCATAMPGAGLVPCEP